MDSRDVARRAPVVPGPPAGRGADRPGAQHIAGGVGGAGQPAVGGSLRRGLARTLLGLTAATALTLGAAPASAAPASAAPGSAPAADLVAFAEAFNAAWNAHDVEGVAAFFAPDATVRQTSARVAGAGDAVVVAPVIEDVYGAGPRSLADAHDPATWAQGEVLWATGPAAIRAWLPPVFATSHRVEAVAYRAEADVVAWRFRAFADPYQQALGVAPVEGTASLVVRAGRAVSFGFDTEGEAVARRARQFDAALNTHFAAAAAAFRPPVAPGPQRPAAAAAGRAASDGLEPRLLLGLVGAAALAGLLAHRRRPRRSPSGRPRPGPGDGALAEDARRTGRERGGATRRAALPAPAAAGAATAGGAERQRLLGAPPGVA